MKVPRSECSRERMTLTKVPGNESSRAILLRGAKVPGSEYVRVLLADSLQEANLPGSEKAVNLICEYCESKSNTLVAAFRVTPKDTNACTRSSRAVKDLAVLPPPAVVRVSSALISLQIFTQSQRQLKMLGNRHESAN